MHLLKLDRVQNSALRIIGGFIKTTPIHVMESELFITPLNFRRQYLATKFFLKTKAHSSNASIKILKELDDLCQTRYWDRKKKPLLIGIYNAVGEQKLYSCNPLPMFSLDTWTSRINTNFICTEIEDVTDSKKNTCCSSLKFNTFKMLNSKYNGWHRIFTDGSKMRTGLGAAFYDPSCNVKELYKITSDITIMSSELFAISEAISYASRKALDKFVILTDSKCALQHIARCTSGTRGVSIAYDICRKLLQLTGNGVSLRLQWIPAHIGVSGNEVVDSLAKSAISSGTEVYVYPDHTEVFLKFKLEVYNNWKMHFNEISKSKGIWYKIIQNEPLHIPWFTNIKMCRELIVLALRLRSGHIPLNSFNYLMRKSDSKNCSMCGSTEDTHHLLVECVRSEYMRTAMTTLFNLNFADVGIFLSILAAPSSSAARSLYIFILRIMRDT